MAAPILTAERRWSCPNCEQATVTRAVPDAPIGGGSAPFHRCRGLRGLDAPLVPDGTRCKVEAVERGDYVGRDVPQTDAEGRPMMSVVTTRDDGQDCAVLAPCVTGGSHGLGG